MKKILILAIFLFSINFLFSQKIEKKQIIIDTDCVIDDFRTIVMFLAIQEIDILAVTTSDGGLNPFEGLKKVKSLLTDFHKTNIPIAAGNTNKSNNPVWRNECQKVVWGKNVEVKYDLLSANKLLITKLDSANKPVTIVCLGSLSNITEALKLSPNIKRKIERIIWYCQSMNPPQSFNYEIDKKAADYILEQNIEIHIVSNLDNQHAKIDSAYIKNLKLINNQYSSAILNAIHSIENHELVLWDDLIAVYLLSPELFDLIPVSLKTPNIKFTKSYNIKFIKEKIYQIVSQNYSTENNIVFERFPVSVDLFQLDVRDEIDTIIKKHGLEEWKKCVLTNEIHGHLGLISIIGAKMGIKAREILLAPIDRLQVISHAGSKPPLSCLNDGLQVSTGSTVGFGTFSLSDEKINKPEAIFIYKNRKIKICLKDVYFQQSEKEIENGILKYGNLTEGYWKLVRKVAIKYWKEWSRNEIFDIEEIK